MAAENNNGADYSFKSYSSNVFRYLDANPDKATMDNDILNNYEKSITEDLLSSKLKKVSAHDIDTVIALVKKRQDKYSSLLKEFPNDTNNADRTAFRGDIGNLFWHCDRIIKSLEHYKQEVWAVVDAAKKGVKELKKKTVQHGGVVFAKPDTYDSEVGWNVPTTELRKPAKAPTKDTFDRQNMEPEIMGTILWQTMKWVPGVTYESISDMTSRILKENSELVKEPTDLEKSKKQVVDMLGKLNPPIVPVFTDKQGTHYSEAKFMVWSDSIRVYAYDNWQIVVKKNDIPLQEGGAWAQNAVKRTFHFATVDEVKAAIEALQMSAVK